MMKQHRTSNLERRTLNEGGRAELWALDVGCWMLDVSPDQGGEITIKQKIKSLYQNEFFTAAGRARQSLRAVPCQPNDGAQGLTRPTCNGHFATRFKIKSQGFTLIEILLAVGIFAIVLLAMNTVFFSAMRLERATSRAVDERLPLNQAFATLRRDLLGAVPPLTNSVLLPRNFISSGSSSGMSSGQAGSLEFYTTTGSISDDAPWGDVQKVRYELVAATDPANNRGQDLVRVVTRNILATTTEDEEEQFLVGNVESLEFQCYDGSGWRSTWDSSAADAGLPLAVQVRVLLAPENPGGKISREPLVLLVPITTQTLTNSLAGGAQ